jgi:IS30 family transposase
MCIKDGFSPKQMAGRIPLLTDLRSISHETIYKYTKRSATYRSRGQIKNRISINFRPAIEEENSRVGDLKVDTIIGKNHHQAIVTRVDRNSKFTLMK